MLYNVTLISSVHQAAALLISTADQNCGEPVGQVDGGVNGVVGEVWERRSYRSGWVVYEH